MRYRSHARIHAILTEHPGEPRSERTFTTSEDLRAGASGTWFLSPLGLVVVLLVLAANRAQRSPEFVSWRTMARLMSDVMPHSKMQDCIDYDAVAELYDLYAAATYDYDFFLSRISPGMRVLELTSGTGRLSIPLAKAGAVITCVDISQGMLSVLERKLEKGGLQANLLCADIQHLDFNEEFKIAVLPFQSFMELVGKEKQLNALRSIYQALMLNGRFYCTMHNPAVRRSMVDGVVRAVGSFESARGHIVVTGFETGGDPVVRRSQFIERFDEAGHAESRILQLMEFEMIDEGTFREMAVSVGFHVTAVFGDYTGRKYDAETSPVMIWELEKCEA